MVFKYFSLLYSPWIQTQQIKVTGDHRKSFRIYVLYCCEIHIFPILRMRELPDGRKLWSSCEPQILRILQALYPQGWSIAGAGNRETWTVGD